jgi:hypothetical protein
MTRKISKEFILDDENLIFGFFDEMGISVHSVFNDALMTKFPQFTEKEVAIIFENNLDEIYDFIFQSEIGDEIKCESFMEEEIEESTGLWGYYKFEILDEPGVKKYFEELLYKILLEMIVKLKEEGQLII